MNSALKQEFDVQTNLVDGSICNVQVSAIKFADLWVSYPDNAPYVDPKTGEPPKGYEDQCAIKVSAAIIGAGGKMKSFKGATVNVGGEKLAIRAQELSGWLALQPFCGLPKKPENVTGKNWQDKIRGRTGIIVFKDYWLRKGEKTATGDHVDLWNQSKLTPGWASTYRFTLGFSSSWLFDLSDFANSREILFWEIK
ncbi:hypothetical protein J2W30_005409 [Variovorax boronicumulans]|uniref:type VI secretion system amidase effector protein Tae4 n=2 Tax=Variovorax TaxID=34072 RepID=UPI00277F459C|nr:T6SS effector amidase Tae4 family protein [Variovorax boronicumulans]MDQ0037632.1 hypothetical protein [Variovorax boronicumulans]